MNKILVVSIAALFALMVFVGESQQQSTFPPPTVHYGCTCMGKPQGVRSQFGANAAGGFGGRGGFGGQHRGPPAGADAGARQFPRFGENGRPPMPDMSQLPAHWSHLVTCWWCKPWW